MDKSVTNGKALEAFERLASFTPERGAETCPEAVLRRAAQLFPDMLGIAIAALPIRKASV